MSVFRSLFRPHTILDGHDRTTAIHVIGQPGCGKSRALESWAWQDICAGNGIAVIDPAGDLFEHLLVRLATRPDLWARVVIIDPCDPEWLVRLNPLTAMRGSNASRIALFMTDVVVRLWKLDATQAPRAVWLMTNTFLALAALNLTLLDLPKFLLNKYFRDKHLPLLPQDLTMVRRYFFEEFPKSAGGARQWTLPILNKLGGLLFDTDIRLMVSGTPALDFRRLMDERAIVLVNMPKGILGEDTASLMAAFIVAMFQKAALSRADVSLEADARPQYFLYLDEFQNYTTQNISDILAESRKYGLSLVLAHQYLGQLSKELQDAVLNTVGTLACFRVGSEDAMTLARYVFADSDYQMKTEWRFSVRDTTSLPHLQLAEQRSPYGWDKLAATLATQPTRAFWMRRKGNGQPRSLRTLDVFAETHTPLLDLQITALRKSNGMKQGIAKAIALANDSFSTPLQNAAEGGETRRKRASTKKAAATTTPSMETAREPNVKKQMTTPTNKPK